MARKVLVRFLFLGSFLLLGWGVVLYFDDFSFSSQGGEGSDGESRREVLITLSGQTMGTTYTVKYIGEKAGSSARQDVMEQRLLAFNSIFSTYEAASEVSLLNDHLGTGSGRELVQVQLSEFLFDQLAMAQSISAWTDGFFDVSVGSLVEVWGLGTASRDDLPKPEVIAEILNTSGYTRIMLHEETLMGGFVGGMRLDFSAIAKGRGVDTLGEYLEEEGVGNYLVEIGGELRSLGAKVSGDEGILPWRLSIASPERGKMLVVVEEEDLASQPITIVLPMVTTGVATSGNYQQYRIVEGVRYSHIIDPHTGYPVRHALASVTVVTETCERSDALATAFMAMGGEQGRIFAEEHDLAVFFIEEEEGRWVTYTSPAFRAYVEL